MGRDNPEQGMGAETRTPTRMAMACTFLFIVSMIAINVVSEMN